MSTKFIFILALTMIALNFEGNAQKNLETLFVGTYTNEESEGIYSMQFNTETGALINSKLAAKITNPSYLVINPEKGFLYAVQETNDFENGSGAITAFSMKNDTLTELQTVTSGGAHPCHLS